ncbi:MAG TPA: alpha/beta hydrolase [Hyphomicrobiaceae bacterium]|nr:alpha/beta hydrolase [Hyphomicrobiaceae bacterium]
MKPPEQPASEVAAHRPAEPADRWVRLGDGRRICYREFGAADGFPVVALHGTPGSRLKFAATHACAASLGLRLICPDRWAYGGSDAPKNPVLADYARDIEQLADALGLDTFALAGISGGGPYAAAVAAKLGRRIARLALISPVGPLAGATPWAELRPFHRFCFRVLPRLPGAIPSAFGFLRVALAVAPHSAVRLTAWRAAAADRALLFRDPLIRDSLAKAFHAGLAAGLRGPSIDLQIFSSPWNVPLGRTAAASRVWLGTADRNVPLAAAQNLARALDAQLIRLEGAGHFWFCRHYEEVLSWLGARPLGQREGDAGGERTPADTIG